MDRSSAGISGQYAGSGNDDNQPDDQASSSRHGRYGYATVRQWDTPSRTAPARHEFYHSSSTRSSQHLQYRSVNPAQDFNTLTKQEIMDDLVSQSYRFGQRYDGRHHGRYASSIKKYTSASKRPLNRAEQIQLIRLMQNFSVTRSWNWRSLTTTLHSFTSAGVFTPHNPIDERVKGTQAALLSTLLDAIIFKCNQKPPARDIDAQGVANLLWAMAKLVDSGQERTPGLNKAVAALLPHMNAQKDQFIPQHIANLVWAMAKLVNNGLERTPEFNEAMASLLSNLNAQKAHFKPQEITNLLWAMAKLVDNGQERTPELKETVAALLPHVNIQKAHFKPQEIANLLWAMAKLVDNWRKQTPGLKGTVAVLLPLVNAQKNQFNAQDITNLLWAMAKLVDNGLEQTSDLNEAVAALLLLVNAQKANFKPQEIANLLWATAKLVEKGQEWTPQLKEAVAVLLPQVNPEKANFKPQEIANLLWAMAKLVDSGLETTSELKEAVAALLPHVNAQKNQFIPQHIANLLWAMAKLLDSGEERTTEFNEAVAALLPHVNAQKANFTPQGIANLLWAMAKLVDSGQEQTPELKETVAALLPHVNAQKANFKPQEIANLLWATAKLGEFVELNVVTSMFESLVYRISVNPQFSQQDLLMSLWGVMVCCARLSLDSNNNNWLEKHMDDLFTRMENTFPDNEEEQSVITMAASWLGRACPVVPHYPTTRSKPQSEVRHLLLSCFPSLQIEEEQSLNSLPPVDLLLPDHNLVIEVQGPSHYVGGDFNTRKGSTLLKIALLQKAGFEVIEIPVNRLGNQDLMKPYIDQIKTRTGIPPQGHGSVSLKRRWADAPYVTADKGRQLTDHGDLTAEKQLQEPTGKPAKRKRKNNQ
ncbi:RAP domain-containing protein [Endozoicomonas sp. GU-1]|uniref:RAP domain-containing protein n=1 Tax=Endozoicomonas sp. GU-1 TaxID=3009078 RepID=UPI0022B3B615|nr:RAP domain-containing protein [Endozoicomonas sp. GU-1]WBA79345.1 DUF1601 domain-containing protein [Endozoicomonas sp. GU-1]WBA86986.1 DUF1601 domain-containing protein [Endozoicomonas sp. GU-1]